MKLSQLIDFGPIQNMVEANYRGGGLPIGITDPYDGEVFAAAGWQEICTKFHRVNPISKQRCIESGRHLSNRIKDGKPYRHRCRNGLWDIGIPIVVDGVHLGTIILGQFFFKDEVPDREFFIHQAEELGYDIATYLDAFDRVPVFDSERVGNILEYNSAIAQFIGDLAFKNKRLKQELEERRQGEEEVERLNAELENRIEQRTSELVKTNKQLGAEIEERMQKEEALKTS